MKALPVDDRRDGDGAGTTMMTATDSLVLWSSTRIVVSRVTVAAVPVSYTHLTLPTILRV